MLMIAISKQLTFNKKQIPHHNRQRLRFFHATHATKVKFPQRSSFAFCSRGTLSNNAQTIFLAQPDNMGLKSQVQTSL